MRTGFLTAALIGTGLFLNGCASDGAGGPGYLFLLIFVVAPIVAFGVLLLKRSESTSESLYILEGQIKRLSAKLDNLEEKISEILDKENKGRTKKP